MLLHFPLKSSFTVPAQYKAENGGRVVSPAFPTWWEQGAARRSERGPFLERPQQPCPLLQGRHWEGGQPHPVATGTGPQAWEQSG